MFAVIIIASIIFLCGFILGWATKGNKTTVHMNYDPVVAELRRRRLDNYFNNPVVDELKKH